MISPLLLLVSIFCCQVEDESAIHITKTDGSMDGGWVVRSPAGDSDYFNVRYDLPQGTLVRGASISVIDFGASTTFPQVGIFQSNVTLDPTGNTPELSSPAYPGSIATDPDVLGGPDFQHHFVDLADGVLPNAPVHVSVQFPPGDFGLLGIGTQQDSNMLGGGTSPGNPNPFDVCGFTTNGYSTPASDFSGLGEFGLNLVVDPSGNPSGELRLTTKVDTTDLAGDFLFMATERGYEAGFFFSCPVENAVMALFLADENGNPLLRLTPILSGNNHQGSTYLRVGTEWPGSLPELALDLVAVWGRPQVGVEGITNGVILYSYATDLGEWGQYGDDTFETGWVVAGVAGNSDYFNVNYGPATDYDVKEVTAYKLSVMDFGSSLTAYPRVGMSPANLVVDPSGNTPDLSTPYFDAPLVFPPLTFATTVSQMTSIPFSPSIQADGLSEDTHGYAQFPPGDPALLGIGADTHGSCIGINAWTLDGFQTPANLFGLGPWGMRLDHTTAGGLRREL